MGFVSSNQEFSFVALFLVALVHFFYRNLRRVCLPEDPFICNTVYAEKDTQFVWIRGSINLSLIEIVQMEAWGSPMLGAVHWGVNYGPVSLCGLVALPRQSLTCSSGVFHFKSTILLWSRSNRSKVRGYCATKWFIMTSTARTASTPFYAFAYTISLFTHTWPHTL